MGFTSVKQLQTVSDDFKSFAEAAMEAGGGLLRLTPTWAPRSLLQPGRLLKLDPWSSFVTSGRK